MTHAVMRNVNFGENFSRVSVTGPWLPSQGSQSKVSILLKGLRLAVVSQQSSQRRWCWWALAPVSARVASTQIHGQTRYMTVPLPRLHPFTPRSQVLLPYRSCDSLAAPVAFFFPRSLADSFKSLALFPLRSLTEAQQV